MIQPNDTFIRKDNCNYKFDSVGLCMYDTLNLVPYDKDGNYEC